MFFLNDESRRQIPVELKAGKIRYEKPPVGHRRFPVPLCRQIGSWFTDFLLIEVLFESSTWIKNFLLLGRLL